MLYFITCKLLYGERRGPRLAHPTWQWPADNAWESCKSRCWYCLRMSAVSQNWTDKFVDMVHDAEYHRQILFLRETAKVKLLPAVVFAAPIWEWQSVTGLSHCNTWRRKGISPHLWDNRNQQGILKGKQHLKLLAVHFFPEEAVRWRCPSHCAVSTEPAVQAHRAMNLQLPVPLLKQLTL